MRKVVGLVAAIALVFGACGGAEAPPPAAFEEINVSECVKQPIPVPGISVLGYRIENVSDLEVCLDVKVKANAVPEIVEFPDCGSPCYAIVLDDFDIAGDSKIKISMTRDGKPQTPIEYDPDPISYGSDTGRVCIAGIGGPPDPCTPRVIKPEGLTAKTVRTTIELGWKAAQHSLKEEITGYEVWRSATGEPDSFTLIGSVDKVGFMDSELTRNTQFWYYVVALASDGTRAASNEVTATTKK